MPIILDSCSSDGLIIIIKITEQEIEKKSEDMQKNENEQTRDNNDICEEIQAEHEEDIQCRVLLPSLFNKSAIHTLNLANAMLLELPPIPPNTQKLHLSYNMLTVFPTGFPFLKEITINNNCIERLPEEINTMECLRVIRANNNQIVILPHLPLIRHLELNKNPIKLITTKLAQTRLQRLSFDWLPFLIVNHPTMENHDNMSNDQFIVYELCDIISRASLESIQEFVGFEVLFQVNSKSKINVDVNLAYLLHRAVSKRADFFIDFLKNNFAHINFNHLCYGDQLLLVEILEQKYDKALELYRLRRSNLNEAEVFMSNLLLACKYNSMELFGYLVKNGLRRHIIQQNEEEIIQIIFRNFDLDQHSDSMLAKILHLANFTKQNKKVFHLPRSYSIRESENISEGILFVMKNDALNQLFSFQFAVWDDILEPLLHFAMASRRSGLVKIILEKYKSPFVKNYAGKLAKTIRGSTLCRKLIMKYEKIYLRQKFQQGGISEPSSPPKNKMNSERWFEIVYDKEERNCYGTPIKCKSFDETVCMGPKLHSAQRSIHKRNVLPHRLKTQSKPKLNLSYSFSIPQINADEETGILYDFALSQDKTLATNMPTNQNKMSNLAIYEAYQRILVNSLVKDYDKQNSRLPTRSFLFSPLSICQDVQYDEEEREEYYKVRNNNSCKGQEIWHKKCRDSQHEGEGEISQKGEIKLNQQF